VPKKKSTPPTTTNAKRTHAGKLEKTIYTTEYSVVLLLLKECREASGITQVDLAKLLGQTQSFVSKIERGDRRLDIIQLRTILQHFNLTLSDFVAKLEKQLTG
jgi:ribosome-binding protein aMBF1 (putative translation factor)